MTRIAHYYIFVIVLALGFGYNVNSTGAVPPPPDIDANSTLEDYLTFAAMNNPNLKAAYNDWKAAVERVPQAKALDDPILAYEHYVVRMQERWNIGISQAIPWFGKLKLREDIAAKQALSLYYKYLSKHLELNFNISKAYYDYHYLGNAILTTQENIELLKRIEQTTLTRYRSSQTTQSDLLRIQVEVLKLEDKLRNLNGLTEP